MPTNITQITYPQGSLHLDLPDMHIQVVLGDEGIILDVFDANGDLIDTTYKFWEEFDGDD